MSAIILRHTSEGYDAGEHHSSKRHAGKNQKCHLAASTLLSEQFAGALFLLRLRRDTVPYSGMIEIQS